MEKNKSPKIPIKFECKKCNYNTSSRKDYNKHLLTAKHQKETNGNEWNSKIPTCEYCEKTFKTASGLWKHKQNCYHAPEYQEEPIEAPTKNTDSEVIIELLKQNQEFKQLMVDQSKQIQEQHDENQVLQKQLIEAVKVGGSHIENQTINNNQKFNLNLFLNEQCKDAINMSDFIENMELDIEDLTETGRLGYVGGISRILVNKLQELDIYKRPLHCTDVKRETLYIKENNEWSKEDNSKDKISNIIGQVANKNCKNIKQWTDEHPDYQIFDSPENMEYVRLTQAVLGGFGEQETRQFKDKIVRSVFKEVMIQKL
jgi:hypothetical protein|uniref:C2H2-type domain-containing protein n=1 Tax=viral metagenome TaxID=1070528 RepID=A0A6C0IJ55_9ZZZZ